MTENKRFNDFRGYKRFDTYFDDYMQLWTVSDNENDNMLYPCTSENMANEFAKLLNELHDEKKWLEMNNKDLVSFIKSKGYTLKDFLEYIGQFRSVGVNKEDWND